MTDLVMWNRGCGRRRQLCRGAWPLWAQQPGKAFCGWVVRITVRGSGRLDVGQEEEERTLRERPPGGQTITTCRSHQRIADKRLSCIQIFIVALSVIARNGNSLGVP